MGFSGYSHYHLVTVVDEEWRVARVATTENRLTRREKFRRNGTRIEILTWRTHRIGSARIEFGA